MPIVNVELARLNQLLGQQLLPEEVHQALEQLGCDVEEIVEISRARCPACGNLVESSMGAPDVRSCPFCGAERQSAFATVDRITVVRLDLLAARPDLFDIGGLVRALRGFLDLAHGLPDSTVHTGSVEVEVAAELAEPTSYRPFIRCAVVTVPRLDEAGLVSIMKLQESLHWGIGRNRKLASIGVYDLDTVASRIRYQTLDPDTDTFEPLGMPGRAMTGRQILAEHPKGIAYAHLLSDLARYPVLVDERGQVLSMPPVINSEATKLGVGARRLFIDVTGISEAAVVKSLATLVSSLLELGGRIESVRIVGPDGSLVSPDLAPREMEIDRNAAESWLGLTLDPATLVRSLRRMRFDVAAVDAAETRFQVRYPAFRTDVKHMVDIFEDLAIGYGYQRIEPRLIPTMTIGEARPEELLSGLARSVLLGFGFSEVMSLPLASEEDHYVRLREPVPTTYVRVANPKVKGLTVVRSHLLGGLLRSLHDNRRRPLPVRLFEIDDVVALDPDAETGARNCRHLAFAELGPEVGYAAVRAVLDSLLRELGEEAIYTPSESPTFLPGRCAHFSTKGGMQGKLGELHPETLIAFGLQQPVAVADLSFPMPGECG